MSEVPKTSVFHQLTALATFCSHVMTGFADSTTTSPILPRFAKETDSLIDVQPGTQMADTLASTQQKRDHEGQPVDAPSGVSAQGSFMRFVAAHGAIAGERLSAPLGAVSGQPPTGNAILLVFVVCTVDGANDTRCNAAFDRQKSKI